MKINTYIIIDLKIYKSNNIQSYRYVLVLKQDQITKINSQTKLLFLFIQQILKYYAEWVFDLAENIMCLMDNLMII
jgi:hypothetical protein